MDSYIYQIGQKCVSWCLSWFPSYTLVRWIQSSCVKQTKVSGPLCVWSGSYMGKWWMPEVLVVAPFGEGVHALLFEVMCYLWEYHNSFFKGSTVQHGILLFCGYLSVLTKPQSDQISPKLRTKKGIGGWQLVWGGLVEISLWREIKRKKVKCWMLFGLIAFDIHPRLVCFSSEVALCKTGQSVGLGADEQRESSSCVSEKGYCKDT